MSYQDGWAAINLDMPARVPRTEYSVDGHWELVKKVTGLDVDVNSPDSVKQQASTLFVSPKYWNFDFYWMITIGAEFGDYSTKMGHAEFAAGGKDFDDDIRNPFQTPEDVLAFDPFEKLPKKSHAEMVKFFEDYYRKTVAQHPDCVNMGGIYVTCVSGLIDLFGWDMLLMAAGTDPEQFGHVTNRYAQWVQRYFDALADTSIPVAMVHDDIVWSEGAFTHPDWYRKYVFPNYKKLLAPLREAGKKIIYTCDGNYTEFVDDIVDSGVNGFVMEPFTDMKYIADKYGKTHSFVGNADTRVLLSGTRDDIRREVERCMAIGKHCPGFFMAVGNHIPANTPVENCLWYNECYEKLSRR